jgi:hypothetical protein
MPVHLAQPDQSDLKVLKDHKVRKVSKVSRATREAPVRQDQTVQQDRKAILEILVHKDPQAKPEIKVRKVR